MKKKATFKVECLECNETLEFNLKDFPLGFVPTDKVDNCYDHPIELLSIKK